MVRTARPAVWNRADADRRPSLAVFEKRARTKDVDGSASRCARLVLVHAGRPCPPGKRTEVWCHTSQRHRCSRDGRASLTQMQLLGVGSDTNVAEGYPRFALTPGQQAIAADLPALLA